MSTPMITMAPMAMIMATPRCDCSVFRIRASVSSQLLPIAQADFDAQRIVKRGGSRAGQIEHGGRLAARDEADARDLERVRGDRAGRVVVDELRAAGPGRGVRLERARDRLCRVAHG